MQLADNCTGEQGIPPHRGDDRDETCAQNANGSARRKRAGIDRLVEEDDEETRLPDDKPARWK
jgi:hypothetical protein